MSTIESFSAVSGSNPRLLVLGSIPGIASLQAVQYYAHPRNAFWPIMADYFGFPVESDYQQRLSFLTKNKVALWDVLQRCERPGSLDSAIKTDSIEINPIDRFTKKCSSLKGILLNGGKAAKEFHKAFPDLTKPAAFQIQIMPSTSPAYAAMPFAEKKQRWHDALSSMLSD